MPSDKNKKKGSHQVGTQNKNALKLHADAKEFVPSSATLIATVGNVSKPAVAASSTSSESSGKAPSPKAAENSWNVVAAKSPPVDVPKQMPQAPAAPSAWGGKPSEAIKTAGPIKPQQKPVVQKQQQMQAPQRQQHPSAGQRQQHQPAGPGGRDGGRLGGGRSGNRQDGGSGANVRATAKPASGGGKEDGGNHRGRLHQSRGGNVSSGGNQGGSENNPNWSRGKALPLDLMKAGEGNTDAEKAVKRINAADLLAMRLIYLVPPSFWNGEAMQPPPACLWDSPTRISEIEEGSNTPRIGGDVSQRDKNRGKSNPVDTAPPLEECKPLEVNDETRWKAKVMESGSEARAEEAESTDEILRKAMLILNKLSLTKFDKLSVEFINCGIGRDIECLTGAVGLIVNYAQMQQHFSSMYAGLCLKLAKSPFEGIDEDSKKGKQFKKILLTRCQVEFETDTATKIKEATKEITNPEEIEYHSNIIKKHYLGHMRFIGELYKNDLISVKIMLRCLPALLQGDNEESSDDIDEEKVECFSQLMTVIGSSLEQQSEAMKALGKDDAAESLADCWRTVEIMAGKEAAGPKVSNRIKFILQGLLEMKENGWITRRKEETAKTLAQIHKEVANEERATAKRTSSSTSLRGNNMAIMRRGVSSGDVRVLDKAQDKPKVDEDGFMTVATSKGFNRSASMTAIPTNQSDGFSKYSTRGSSVFGKVDPGSRHPSQSKLKESKSSRNGSRDELVEKTEEKLLINCLTPDECGKKATSILKEFFAGGDTHDAVISLHELVGVGTEGSFERGTKVVESAVLMVLEMKQEDVNKFLSVYMQCAKENKIEPKSFVFGLMTPLEFLSDIAIDAPLAIQHLSSIVAELVKAGFVPFDFLLNSPEYFRSDQNAADFGAKVMKRIGSDATSFDGYIEVIEKLMTDEDKEKYSSAKDLIAES
ncbi:hypothetical protein ACHAXH_008272 [Discostella pseudostelligera]